LSYRDANAGSKKLARSFGAVERVALGLDGLGTLAPVKEADPIVR